MQRNFHFLTSSTYLLCVFGAAFLLLVWPFPTIFGPDRPVAFFVYLYVAWGGCIAAVFLWARASARRQAQRRSRMLQNPPGEESDPDEDGA